MENEHRAAEFGREGRLVNLNPALILEFLLPCQWILLIHFGYGPNTCSHYTKVWHSTHLMCNAPLSTSEKCSFDSIRYRNRAAKELSVIVYSGGQHRDALQNAIAWFLTKITFTLLHKANIFWQLNLYLKQNSSAGLLNQRQRPSKTIFVYHFFAVKLLEYALRWNYSHGRYQVFFPVTIS